MKLVARIELWNEEPVPWSVPEVCHGVTRGGKRYRRVKKDKRLGDWQKKVSDAAKAAMDHMSAVTGPVKLQVAFFREADPRKGQRVGQVWLAGIETDGDGDLHKMGRDPDLTNLEKAWEDGIEGHPFVNDVQVCVKESGRFYGPASGVVCSVFLLEPTDYPGHTDESSDRDQAEEEG